MPEGGRSRGERAQARKPAGGARGPPRRSLGGPPSVPDPRRAHRPRLHLHRGFRLGGEAPGPAARPDFRALPARSERVSPRGGPGQVFLDWGIRFVKGEK